MKNREGIMLFAYRRRWRVLGAAIFFPLPLLIAVFRNSSLEGWGLLSAVTFALFLTVWLGLIAFLSSPIRYWRMFKVVLIALACLLVRALLPDPVTPAPSAVLILGSAAVLLLVAAVRIQAPSEEEIRIARMADEPGGGHVSGWMTVLLGLLALAVLAIPLISLLKNLHGMMVN